MTRMIFALGTLAAMTLAGSASANSHIEKASGLPRCSATVRDSCDQSMTTEKNAMTADQAMASGGVGDRQTSGAMRAARPMLQKKAMRRKMSTSTMTTTEPMSN